MPMQTNPYNQAVHSLPCLGHQHEPKLFFSHIVINCNHPLHTRPNFHASRRQMTTTEILIAFIKTPSTLRSLILRVCRSCIISPKNLIIVLETLGSLEPFNKTLLLVWITNFILPDLA